MTVRCVIPELTETVTLPTGTAAPVVPAWLTTPEMLASAARMVALTCVALGAPEVTLPNPSMPTESTCDSRSARENVTV